MSLPKSIKIGYAVFLDHIPTPALLRAHTARLFDWIAEGKLEVQIGGEYSLADAAQGPRRHGEPQDHGQAAAGAVGGCTNPATKAWNNRSIGTIMDKHEFNRMNSTVISEFRATGGKASGVFSGKP